MTGTTLTRSAALAVGAFGIGAAALGGSSASAADSDAAVPLDPVVVTATRNAERALDIPASIDSIGAAAIRDGQPMVNLSESLVRVPGVYAANRNNYAQDLQISSRGFGARAPFGVRGVRIYQDGIPQTQPDGQGQTGSFSLLSAARIEVLRGPFSSLYGNASGGVISVFTENPSPAPYGYLGGGGGSYRMWTAGAKGSAASPTFGGIVAASEFQIDGYRDHASARRDIGNAKLTWDPTADTHLTLIGNSQYQPETQDPLGLTRAEWQANPRQADPVATTFNTRKTINQVQGGIGLDQRLNDAWSLTVTGYLGNRRVEQFLALSGVAPTSSGGVTSLDGTFQGIGARVIWRGEWLGGPVTFTLGGDADKLDQTRKGFVNQNGQLGDLRRNENDIVSDIDGYAQIEWSFAPAFFAVVGVRTSAVKYTSDDFYITPQNPNDSGQQTYHNTGPALGLTWRVTDTINAYATYGEGFETPTLVELAYRNVGTGLNFGLQPATSQMVELGVKAVIASQHRVTLAVFGATTRNEIVIDTATGGRTTYKNADRTKRRGLEAEWTGAFPYGITTQVALTWLKATFEEPFSSGTPPTIVPTGARLPGAPPFQAYGELAWTPGGYGGFNTAVEMQAVGKVYVNERNSDAAPAYQVANARVGFAQAYGAARFTEFVRVNNLFNRNYSGSVIVGDTNSRYFEPSPRRNFFLGANVNVAL